MAELANPCKRCGSLIAVRAVSVGFILDSADDRSLRVERLKVSLCDACVEFYEGEFLRLLRRRA